jgi:hypothetical protein
MEPFTVEESKSTKTHTLFMGADIAINLDKDLFKVEDVNGSNWIVDIDGRKREISAKKAPMNIKITPGLKITEASATIAGFKRLPTYSYANDPSVRLTKGLTDSARMGADLRAIADGQQHMLDTVMANNRGGQFAGTWDQFSDNAMKTTAMYTYSNTHYSAAVAGSRGPPPDSPNAPTTSMNTEGATGDAVRDLNTGLSEGTANIASTSAQSAGQISGKIATQGMDAMDIEFDVRSAKMLHNPYVVTMTRFRTPGMKSGVVQNLIYAHSLHPIDEHSSHVHFLEEGFPFNYELVDFQLHLYDHGEEIATNIASDRIELTRDEAFEYLQD